MAQSKNQRSNRGATARRRMLDGAVVKPVKYVGHWAGRGTYMAGTADDGKSLVTKDGTPLPIRSIGKLV